MFCLVNKVNYILGKSLGESNAWYFNQLFITESELHLLLSSLRGICSTAPLQVALAVVILKNILFCFFLFFNLPVLLALVKLFYKLYH